MSLLTNTQGSPERVWSALAGLSTFGEQSRAELESLLNPGFLKPGLGPVKTVNIRQVIGAASSLGAVEGDRTSAATGLKASAFSQVEMADWMHDVLCALEPDNKDAVILETYAWLVARSHQVGSMAWMHEMNADAFANAAVEGLLGLDDDGGVKMNKEKVVAWRRWLLFLGLAIPLPSPLLPQPSVASRLRRELARAGVAGTTLGAQEFMALVAERLPYLDRGRLFLQACERLGRRPSNQRLSPMLSIALRDLEDEGALQMAQLGDAGGILQLAEDPAHLTKGFLSVTIATDTAPMTHAFACWTAKNATDVIPTEALAGDDAIFLATHTPMTGFDIEGPLRAEIASADEQALLEGLSRTDRNHAFCVVQGEPGSGKSHLIRWLSVKWPKGRDVKLLLRRADGSLEGALRQLKERLPAEFQPLFDSLGQKHRASPQGRANIFLSTLADTLETGHFDPPLEDEAWCRDKKPASLLRFALVRSGWVAPSRILGLLEGAGGQRNSETADFNLFDIQDLARHCVTIEGTGVPPATEELARRLIHEAYTIEEWRSQGWSAEEIGQQVSNKVARSLEFLEILNRRRNDAIQNVLGVSAAGLKTLFRQVREALAKRDQRLVLLLEDITSWEGLDDSLIDVLTFNAEVRGDEPEVDVCPLISVVGVTPAYRVKLQGNYRGRITHEIRLGRVTKELQDVATLRDRPARLAFAARYLAAVRVGPERLDQWAEHLTAEPDLPAPNQCLGCNRREACVGTFGEVNEISLFPFTAQALDRLYDSLKESDNGLTWKTPRGMLQAVLLPSLAEPDLLDQGLYPGVGIEPQPFQDHRRADQVLSANQLSAIIETQMVQSTPAERARMRRTLAYWGDPETADTTEIDGDLALAGASRRVLAAFNLPWIGRSEASEVHQPAQDAGALIVELEAAPTPEPAVAPVTSIASSLRLTPAPRATPSTAPPKPKGPTRTELERLREELRTWTPERPISNLSDWNKTLHLLIRNIDARSIGLAPSVLDRIVTLEMVKLEGTTSRQRNYLSIGPEPWVRSGLEAYVAFKEPGGVKNSGELDYNRRKLAAMIRRLAGIVSDYADRRLGVLADGRRWSPVGSLAQILLARAWLRGVVSPDAPWSEQLQAIAKDEDLADADTRARSKPWQDFLSATNQWHERFRAEVRKAIDLSLGDGQGVADLSEIGGAILRLRETLTFDPTPADAGDVNVNEYDTVRRLVSEWRDELSRVGRIEHDQIVDRGQRLIDLLNGRGIVEHLGQVDSVISTVSEKIPEVAIEKVADWKRRLERVKARFEEGGPERSEALLFALMGGEGVAPSNKTSRLGWLARAPARNIEDYRDLVAAGDQALSALMRGAQDVIGAGGSGSLAQIHNLGDALQAVLDRSRVAQDTKAA